MSEISKAYEPQSVEDKWYDFWLKHGCFTADPNSAKPAYSIVIPPPNVTGMLHMGHVLNNTIQDILSRKARMDGKEVLWLPGTDHAGIATQMMVEKQLKKEEKKSRHDLGREEFLKRVWAWKEKHGDIIINQLKKLGCSCDWTRERFTMDPEYSRCVQKVFVDLYKKGLIYRGKRMVNWCPVSQTALSDEEVEMKPQKGFMYHFKVQVAESLSGSSRGNEAQTGKSETGNRKPEISKSLLTSAATEKKEGGPGIDSEGRIWLTIATTRPETIPGDTAVAVNPKDPRYAHLIGKHIVRPLPAELPHQQKLIPIIGDEHVDFEFGTGVLKVTPAHDKADFDIGTRHKLPLIEVINADGSMNDLAGADLRGLDRFKARKIAVEKLRELEMLVEEKPYENNVGFSQRADVPIEPRLSEQWFLKYPAVEQSKACVAQDGYVAAPDLSKKAARIIAATGKEIPGKNIHELRKAALAYARQHGIIGVPFKNEDSGITIRIGRQSLSHAFSHLGVANILAVVVLPELIRTAVWISSEPHEPHNPMVKRVHRLVAALSLAGELYCVLITAKEFKDGTVLYDHRTKKITFGGKSLEAHLPKEKLDTQPAPNAEVKIGDLLAGVNVVKMRFHPQRWAKVYDHWLTNIQDWCISRQLWWGHRIPVWTLSVRSHSEVMPELNLLSKLDEYFKEFNLSDQVFIKFHGAHQEGLQRYLSGELSSLEYVEICTLSSDADHAVKLLNNLEELGALRNFPLNSAKLFPTRRAWEIAKDVMENLIRDRVVQDPDVLDTWFSSWLWPFATMGWPEQTDTLKKFYPTTDLVTGPDIIFFWVARMIMAGYEFMGDPKFGLPDAMPFQNVYFTGIIRDKQGRKMSKTLGNSPDPLVLIEQYGADALRFGTMRSAPLGQDVLFDEKDVELGRNFCNKLWNACRFRQMVGGTGVTPEQFEIQGEIEPKLLTPDDKWILLKLDAAIREVTIALNEYKFSEATAALYRFFWNEYCDWYVEASKAILRSVEELKGENVEGADASTLQRFNASTAQKANTLALIDFVLSHTIRLFHPFLPFITEELWHGMGYATDMPDNQGGKTIMNAPWPMPFDEDFKGHYGLAESDLEATNVKYELVRNGRDLRRAGNIQAAKKVKYVFKPAQPLTPHDAEVIKLLLNAETLEVKADYQPPKGTPNVASKLGELFLPLEGLIDVAAEKVRLTKEVEKIQSEIVKVEQKLANPNFTQKVPPAVLAEHEQRLVEWKTKLAHTQASLDALG
jgi:valyl-tRNA synthetase